MTENLARRNLAPRHWQLARTATIRRARLRKTQIGGVMSIYLGRRSALDFWRNASSRGSASPTKANPLTSAPPTAKECRKAMTFEFVASKPLELIVGDSTSRRSPAHVKCILWGGCSISSSFAKITKGIYVATPEACFLQLANTLPLVDLVKIGFELCGNYALNPCSDQGFTQRGPLTSTKSLERYINKAAGIVGVKRARQALRHIADGSASPAEANLTMLLCLPTSMGGFGLPLPSLNERIELKRRASRLTTKSYFKCDMYWADIKTAIEYDSDQWHSEEQRRAHDATRRNALESTGIMVITATKAHLYDARETERIALIVARKLKRYHRSTQRGILAKRHALRKALLGATAGEQPAPRPQRNEQPPSNQ